MTRASVKALHDKVNSLLYVCDLDTPLNGLLLHSETLCILRNQLDNDPQWGGEDEQEESQDDGDDAQEKVREHGQKLTQGEGEEEEPAARPVV